MGSNPTPSAIRLRLRYDVINPLGFVRRRVREADASSKHRVDGLSQHLSLYSSLTLRRDKSVRICEASR
ncbi:MAG: hypothetical protein HOI80_04455 [Alphaproteobacteria bacterium]|nr:hypothetical protein [Alphaproteobacteria bacterium]